MITKTKEDRMMEVIKAGCIFNVILLVVIWGFIMIELFTNIN